MARQQDTQPILVVEDEEIVSEVVARYLRREGFRVKVAADGASARLLAAAAAPPWMSYVPSTFPAPWTPPRLRAPAESMDHYQYLILMAACLVATLPLEALGARVYRQPARLARAVLPVALIFLVWDALAIAGHVWSYNPRYVTGVNLPFRIPVEELVFFLVIPVCGILTYAGVQAVSRRWSSAMSRPRTGAVPRPRTRARP